jgi:hypothetical protein
MRPSSWNDPPVLPKTSIIAEFAAFFAASTEENRIT